MSQSKNEICNDCGIDTFSDDKDYYMIRNDLWSKYGVAKKMLCTNCIEKRIGRKLIKEDLIMCIVNTLWNPYTRAILNV